jgi:hypothetical protein
MREREKEMKKNGYKSLSATGGTTTFFSLYIHNDDDDDDDGRRSGICTHSTGIDEMFIFTSSECKYFVYTYSHCIKRKDQYETRKKESLHF